MSLLSHKRYARNCKWFVQSILTVFLSQTLMCQLGVWAGIQNDLLKIGFSPLLVYFMKKKKLVKIETFTKQEHMDENLYLPSCVISHCNTFPRNIYKGTLSHRSVKAARKILNIIFYFISLLHGREMWSFSAKHTRDENCSILYFPKVLRKSQNFRWNVIIERVERHRMRNNENVD